MNVRKKKDRKIKTNTLLLQKFYFLLKEKYKISHFKVFVQEMQFPPKFCLLYIYFLF